MPLGEDLWRIAGIYPKKIEKCKKQNATYPYENSWRMTDIFYDRLAMDKMWEGLGDSRQMIGRRCLFNSLSSDNGDVTPVSLVT